MPVLCYILNQKHHWMISDLSKRICSLHLLGRLIMPTTPGTAILLTGHTGKQPAKLLVSISTISISSFLFLPKVSANKVNIRHIHYPHYPSPSNPLHV